MLIQRDLTTIHFSPMAGEALPTLADPRQIVHLLDDAGESAPSVHWLVRLGGGESRPVDMRPAPASSAADLDSNWTQAVA